MRVAAGDPEAVSARGEASERKDAEQDQEQGEGEGEEEEEEEEEELPEEPWGPLEVRYDKAKGGGLGIHVRPDGTAVGNWPRSQLGVSVDIEGAAMVPCSVLLPA